MSMKSTLNNLIQQHWNLPLQFNIANNSSASNLQSIVLIKAEANKNNEWIHSLSEIENTYFKIL